MVRNEAALQLYKTILRLHRQKLPATMREIGDAYIKKEFRDHSAAKPEHVQVFMDEWRKYASTLVQQNNDGMSKFGEDMDANVMANMTDDQRERLERLRREATSSEQSPPAEPPK